MHVNIRRYAPFFLILLASLCLAACPVEPETDEGVPVEVPLNANKRQYFSLSTGEWVTDPTTDAWDIAFVSHDASVFVLTNSGVTASDLRSGGRGGVWYTEKKDFAPVVLGDAEKNPPPEYAPYTVDVKRYAMIMGANPVEETMNVMTYLGYRDSEKDEAVHGKYGETQENPFLAEQMGSGGMTASYSPYRFNKMAFYSMGGGMPPTCAPTNQVYVILHGDGETHSKVQFPEVYLEYNDAEPEAAFYFLRFVYEKL